jgi:hypothetical protein
LPSLAALDPWEITATKAIPARASPACAALRAIPDRRTRREGTLDAASSI